jgi:hypothetical protein
MHLTNFYASNGPLHLNELSVFPQGSSIPLVTYKRKELAEIAKPRPEETAEGITLAAGSRTVLFLWITLPDGMAPPLGLWHRMSFQDAKGRQRTLQGAALTLAQKPAIVIAPPLRGGRNWLVSEGPGNAHSHNWGSLLALNGVVTMEKNNAPPADKVGPNVLNAWIHGDLLTVNMLGMAHPEFSSMFQRRESAQRFVENQVADYEREDANTSYAWVALYTLNFLDAYLKHDASAKAFLEKTSAENGVPKHFMGIKFSAAQKPSDANSR